MADTSHTHTQIQIPLMSLQPAGREPNRKVGMQFKLVNQAPFPVIDGGQALPQAIQPTCLGHQQLDSSLKEETCLLDSSPPHLTPP